MLHHLFALLLVSVMVAGPSGSACAQAAPAPAAEATRAYALKFGPPGSPAYVAALRVATEKAAEEMLKQRAKPLHKRSVDMNAPTVPTVEVLRQPLSIDSDPRYVALLDEAAAMPVVEIGAKDDEKVEVRSIGGTVTSEYKEIGYAASISSPIKGICSGVLIDRRTVLTAAHCVCGPTPIKQVVFDNKLRGSNRRIAVSGAPRSHEAVRCPSATVTEAEYLKSLKGNDIAVIRLKEAVPTSIAPSIPSSQIGSPSLLKQQHAAGNRWLIVVGFGWIDPGGGDDLKNTARVPILDPDCSGERAPGLSDESVYGCRSGREILARDPRNPRLGPCHGDSGGGAYVIVERKDGQGRISRVPHLVGLVSRSIENPKQECGDGGIFTLLTPELMAWLATTRTALEQQFP